MSEYHLSLIADIDNRKEADRVLKVNGVMSKPDREALLEQWKAAKTGATPVKAAIISSTEHEHDDGTVHDHDGGDKEHDHDEVTTKVVSAPSSPLNITTK